MSQELLLFELDNGTFGVPTCSVREVLRAAALFPLPEYPEFVAGGLNLRGEIVPVVDGRALLSRDRKPIDPADHMIVLGAQARSIAIHVDRAISLTVISQDDLAVPPSRGKFVTQVVSTENGPTAILDVDELFAACEPIASRSSSAGRES